MTVKAQKQIEQERLSWAIAQAIRESMDLNKILETTVTKVRQFLQTDRVIIYRFNPDWSGVVVAESVKAPWTSILDQTITDQCFQNNWVELYKRGRVKAIANIYAANLQPCHIELLAKHQVQANMVVPILQGNGKHLDTIVAKKEPDVSSESRLWGLLIAHHCASPRQWDPSETDLLFSLSTQVALAIQQAELYQQTQAEVFRQRRMASQLSKLNRSVRMLLECNKLLVQATEESKLLQDICQIITKVGGYQLAWVGLTDEATDSLRIKGQAFESEKFESLPCQELELADISSDLIGSAINTYEPRLKKNLKLQTAGVQQDYAVAVALPLHSEGIFGVLNICSKQANAFDVAEVELLEELAETLSYGLMTLRARNQLKQTQKALREANNDLEQKVQTRTAELIKANAELARSNTELEQFAYVASHDLREPLRKIKSYTELLAEDYQGQLDNTADKYITYITDGATRMQALISDLLTYSRVGRENLTLEQTALGAVLEQTLGDLSVTIEENSALIIADPLPTVQANAQQMGQLFLNLIGNGIKFRGEAIPKIEVKAELQDGEWLIAVRDNGIGINPKYAQRIFEIFQRLHSRDKYPGTGIGLAICRKIVERHGGRIWMKSELGQGTTFYFTLPGFCCQEITPLGT